MSNLRLTAFRDPARDAALIATVQAVADAQDRQPYTPPEPCMGRNSVYPATRLSPVNVDTSDFTPHENALFRALLGRFDPAKCVELVIRARKGERP